MWLRAQSKSSAEQNWLPTCVGLLLERRSLCVPASQTASRPADWQSAKQQTGLSALRRAATPSTVAQAAEPAVSQVANQLCSAKEVL